MGFVTPLLLAGAGLVAVPIVLHLIMRREAQQIQFPALRFVQQRKSVNQHRLQLRHWLLLALRCAVIALLAFALARPMLRGAGAAGKESAPVATALVFDNSLRMQYQHENKSRLAAAQELATWVLEQLPPESEVTVVDRAGRLRGQDLDRSRAELRVERLEASASVRPMEEALRDAARWIESKPDHRGEIYVFTDLAAEAWPEDGMAEFAKRLDEMPGTNVFLIDVGVKEPRNVALGALRLSSERLAPGGMLRLDTDVAIDAAEGAEDEVVAEMYLIDAAAKAEKRGQQVAALSRERPAAVEFSLTGLPLGTHQGFVRVAGGDGLSADDVRYFSVEVRPPSKVLLVGTTPESPLFLREALAPSRAAGLTQPKFACDVIQYDQLGSATLADYAGVFLVDPPPLPDATWRAVADYADRGGGVGISLGRNARSAEFNTTGTQVLLPAKLRWVSREATYLRADAVEHPALSELRGLGDAVPWSEFPVFKYWELEAGAEPAHVVASFANGKAAIVERALGSGRVMMVTTSFADRASDDPWNLLPTGSDPWPFLILANGIADYLTGAGSSRQNYQAGQMVVLPLSPDEQTPSYALQMPDGTSLRQSLTPGQDELTISSTEALGNYRVRAGGRQQRLDRGFSVNAPSEVTRLERAADAEVIATLGEERARIARTRDEIEVRVGIGRTGRELFPALIVAVALVLAAEGLLANRFYGGPSAIGSRPSASESIASTVLPKAESRQPTAIS